MQKPKIKSLSDDEAFTAFIESEQVPEVEELQALASILARELEMTFGMHIAGFVNPQTITKEVLKAKFREDAQKAITEILRIEVVQLKLSQTEPEF